MTKKITITLEENLIDQLSSLALQDYFDVNAVTKMV